MIMSGSKQYSLSFSCMFGMFTSRGNQQSRSVWLIPCFAVSQSQISCVEWDAWFDEAMDYWYNPLHIKRSYPSDLSESASHSFVAVKLHMTSDIWHMAHDAWRMTYDIWFIIWCITNYKPYFYIPNMFPYKFGGSLHLSSLALATCVKICTTFSSNSSWQNGPLNHLVGLQ